MASSKAFSSRSFHHREVFGQVGFGTGGWDSDYPNSMLEIFRVVMTGCDENQRLVVGGAEQVPRRIWRHPAPRLAHWPAGTSLASLHSGAPRPGVARITRAGDGRIAVTDAWGDTRRYAAVLVTCQSWLLTTQIQCEESLFSRPRRPEHDAHRPADPRHLPVRQRSRPARAASSSPATTFSWTPAWAEGAVQTSLNAVWGIMHHLGGRTHPDNPGPGDVFADIGPIELPD